MPVSLTVITASRPFASARDPDVPAFRRVLDRVIQQVLQHIPQQPRVAAYRAARPGGTSISSVICFRLAFSSVVSAQPSISSINAHREKFDLHLPGLDPRQLQQIVGQPRQPHSVVADDFQESPVVCRDRPALRPATSPQIPEWR